MDCALGGYRVAPTATHSESARPAASPERTPCWRDQHQLTGASSQPPSPRPPAPTHWRVAGGEEHSQSEGSEEGATEDAHDREGALGESTGVWLRAEPSHLSRPQFTRWGNKN